MILSFQFPLGENPEAIRYFTNHLSIRRQSLTANCPHMIGRAAADIWARACPSNTQNKGGKLRRERMEEAMVSRIAIRPTIFKGFLLGLKSAKV